MRLHRTVLLTNIMIFATCGCKKPTPAPSPERPRSAGSEGQSGSDETISEPVMIGGSFLTCRYDDNAPVESTEIGTRCVVGVDKSKSFKPSDFEVRWNFRNLFNASFDIDSGKIKADGDWVWIIPLPDDKYKHAKVEINLTHRSNRGIASSFSFIDGELRKLELPSGGSSIPSYYVKDLAAFELSTDSGASGNTVAGVTRTQGSLVGIPVRLEKSPALFSFLFQSLAGVTRANNRLMLVRKGQVIQSVNLPVGGTYVMFEGLNLSETGVYMIVLADASMLDGQARDGVTLRSGQITTSVETVVGAPVVLNAISDPVIETFSEDASVKSEYFPK